MRFREAELPFYKQGNGGTFFFYEQLPLLPKNPQSQDLGITISPQDPAQGMARAWHTSEGRSREATGEPRGSSGINLLQTIPTAENSSPHSASFESVGNRKMQMIFRVREGVTQQPWELRFPHCSGFPPKALPRISSQNFILDPKISYWQHPPFC